ncbi:hypothetical protein ACFTT0_11310 [Streptomyces bauhiniae]|uniref:hypothetical protein n=1 Tax=Streptomyces bauhiniae TaxID=2340725 RepID=UPI00362FDBF6
MPQLSEELAGRVDTAVETLLPARRESDPAQLAAVGTSLLRKMPKSLTELTEKAAVQTVRTVALIGGSEALGLLSSYVGDKRDRVVRQLIQSWSYFDPDPYADAVLSGIQLAHHEVVVKHSGQLRALRRLAPTDVDIYFPLDDLGALRMLPPLHDLSLWSLTGEADLSLIPHMPDLDALALDGDAAFTHMEALERFTSLRHLAISVRNTSDLSSLRLAEKTSHLSLWDVHSGTDLTPCHTALSGLDRLYLWAADSSPVNLTALPAVPVLQLQEVDVRAWLETPGFKPPEVEHLILMGCLLPDDRGSLDFPGVEVHIF